MNISAVFSRVAALGAILLSTSVLVSAAPQAGTAEVTALKGTATIGDQPAQKGDTVGTGVPIATGDDSMLDLYLGVNGPTVQVQANTKVTIEELSADVSGAEPVVTTTMNLTEGKVSGYVKKSAPGSSYTIKTATTTAAIRGTVYLVSAEGYVWVWEGCVDVTFQTGGEVRTFKVCAGEMFDPNIPGVVANPYPKPPILVPGAPPTTPTGPVINLSPVKPRPGSPAPTPTEPRD
jgi:hypothetical protein